MAKRSSIVLKTIIKPKFLTYSSSFVIRAIMLCNTLLKTTILLLYNCRLRFLIFCKTTKIRYGWQGVPPSPIKYIINWAILNSICKFAIEGSMSYLTSLESLILLVYGPGLGFFLGVIVQEKQAFKGLFTLPFLWKMSI